MSGPETLRLGAMSLALVAAVSLVAALVLPQGDVALYHHYGRQLSHRVGDWLPLEYPAASAALFALPLALPVGYRLGFAVSMIAALVAMAVTGRRLGAGERFLGRLAVYLGAGTAAVLLARYDLVPALAVVAATLQARRGRFGSAWAAALVGGALKLFPLLLVPGFLIAERRSSGCWPWRRAVLFSAAIAAYGALQAALDPSSLLTPFRYEARRGFEFSSLPGTLTALADPLHLHFRFGFGNWEVFGGPHAAVLALASAGVVVALFSVWSLAWRGRLGVEEVALAVLSVAVLGDRALAPQYLIWLAPLWALWPLRRSFVAAAVLTTLTFPVAFSAGLQIAHSLVPATLVAAVRNVVLVAGSASFLSERLAASPLPGRAAVSTALARRPRGGAPSVLDAP